MSLGSQIKLGTGGNAAGYNASSNAIARAGDIFGMYMKRQDDAERERKEQKRFEETMKMQEKRMQNANELADKQYGYSLNLQGLKEQAKQNALTQEYGLKTKAEQDIFNRNQAMKEKESNAVYDVLNDNSAKNDIAQDFGLKIAKVYNESDKEGRDRLVEMLSDKDTGDTYEESKYAMLDGKPVLDKNGERVFEYKKGDKIYTPNPLMEELARVSTDTLTEDNKSRYYDNMYKSLLHKGIDKKDAKDIVATEMTLGKNGTSTAVPEKWVTEENKRLEISLKEAMKALKEEFKPDNKDTWKPNVKAGVNKRVMSIRDDEDLLEFMNKNIGEGSWYSTDEGGTDAKRFVMEQKKANEVNNINQKHINAALLYSMEPQDDGKFLVNEDMFKEALSRYINDKNFEHDYAVKKRNAIDLEDYQARAKNIQDTYSQSAARNNSYLLSSGSKKGKTDADYVNSFLDKLMAKTKPVKKTKEEEKKEEKKDDIVLLRKKEALKSKENAGIISNTASMLSKKGYTFNDIVGKKDTEEDVLNLSKLLNANGIDKYLNPEIKTKQEFDKIFTKAKEDRNVNPIMDLLFGDNERYKKYREQQILYGK